MTDHFIPQILSASFPHGFRFPLLPNIMLSIVTSALAFSAPGVVSVVQARTVAVSMYSTINEPVVGGTLRDSQAPLGFGKGDEVKGVVVKTNAAKATGIKSFESKFAQAQYVDATKGPPCGVSHHQGSGTGPHEVPGRFFGVVTNMGNCAGEECQIG